MEISLISVSVVVFISMLIYIYKKTGFRESISASYYDFGKRKNFIFWAFNTGYAMPLFFIGDSVLMKIAVIGICFVAVASDFKQWKVTRLVHMYGAVGGVSVSMLALIIDYNAWYLVVANALICSIILLRKKVLQWESELKVTKKFKSKHITWMEISSYFISIIGLLIFALWQQ